MSFAKPASAYSTANDIPRSVKRYTCMANQCPMPGTISGESGNGVCAYHYNTHGPDWPRITQTLLDWAILTEEINRCRSIMCDIATTTNPDLIAQEYAAAWARIKDNLGTWTDQLKPQHMDSYGSWSLRLEQFIGQRVVECTRHRIGGRMAA
jgi:hypothetical protein